MNRLPLRWLLLIPVLVILSVGALALGVYLERSVENDLVETLDEELVRAAGATRPNDRPARFEPTDQAGGAEAPLELLIGDEGIRVLRPEGAVLDEAAFLALRGTEGNQTVDGSPRYRAASQPAQDGQTAVVALSLEGVDQSIASLHRNLIIAGLSLVAAQLLAVWFVAGVVARPVSRMSEVAHDIASGDLDARVGEPKGSKETADLATDLTQMLERLRATIAEQQASAADANQARQDMERFMADASHELRTPLTALKGYSDLYRGGMLDAEGLDRAMSRIGSESERMTELVRGLLDLMKQDSADVIGPVDLATVVDRVSDDISVANPDRTISTAGLGQPVVVTGTTNRLHQAVLNLAANACHHTGASCPIELRLEVDQENAHIAVVDHGDGIDAQDADRLFVAFARADSSRSRKSHDGAGLGLAIVRRIAEQHNGVAWVRETPGGGATFGITVPLVTSNL